MTKRHLAGGIAPKAGVLTRFYQARKQGGYRVDTRWIQGGYRVDTGWIQDTGAKRQAE
jgi:hypothetical protein